VGDHDAGEVTIHHTLQGRDHSRRMNHSRFRGRVKHTLGIF
jgi:hypothetical protein